MTAPGTFTYDDKGNTLTHTINSITTQYTWDHLNRLETWAKTGETTQDYIYNADGIRVRVTPSGVTATNYLLDGDEIAEEITGNGVTSYVGPGLVSQISGTTRTIYHSDGFGSTRAVTSSNEIVAKAAVYDAYGNVKSDYPASSAPNFGYAGNVRYYADSTGLHYLKERYYDSTAGRFLSRDPVGYEAGFNLYAYVDGSPTLYVDPTGEGCFPVASWTTSSLSTKKTVKNGKWELYGVDTLSTTPQMPGIPYQIIASCKWARWKTTTTIYTLTTYTYTAYICIMECPPYYQVSGYISKSSSKRTWRDIKKIIETDQTQQSWFSNSSALDANDWCLKGGIP